VPGLKREDVFITSKLWNSQHHPRHVKAALDDCLTELELDYLDLYLIHFPVSFDETANPHTSLFPLDADGDVKIDDSISIVETWKAMTELPNAKARAIGVSNFGIEHLEAIISATGVTPAANQVERHALLPQKELIEYCKNKGIHVTAYSAFGNNMFGKPLLITYPEIQAIAERIGATPAQVM
jgi:L-glyceraldehyde reductase